MKVLKKHESTKKTHERKKLNIDESRIYYEPTI